MLKPSEFSKLQKLCLRSFPERLDQRISQAELLSETRHTMLSFILSWREGRRPRVERLIVRRYTDPWTWWSLDDRKKARREWTVMRWLYGEGLPVPRLYASGTENGQGFLLIARASGRRCTDLQSEQHGALEPYVGELAALLARLHQLTPPGTVHGSLSGIVVSEEIGRLGEIACQCDDGGLTEAINELLTEKVEVHPLCVLHGDPLFANVLNDARGITTILNWENSALGDPRWDVARAVNWLRDRGADDMAEHFCSVYAAQTGQPLSGMSFWTALAAAQNWTLATWIRAGVQKGNLMKSPATDALISQLATWRKQTWRGLTRLRYEKKELSATSP